MDFDLDPFDTFPLTIADYDNGTAFSDNPPSNEDGKKVDNLGNQGLLLKHWAETALPGNTSQINGMPLEHTTLCTGITSTQV